MPFLENFNPFVDKVPSWPLKQLDPIAFRASRFMSGHALLEIRCYAQKIRQTIDDQKEREVERCMEMYVDRLVGHGGWELKHYPPGQPITEVGVRWLLANWPSDADEEPDVPSVDDISDLDALTTAYEFDFFRNPFPWPATDATKEDEALDKAFALLSLMKVEEALEMLGWTGEHRWIDAERLSVTRLSVAADVALEAADALAVAHELRAEMRARARTTATAGSKVPRAEKRPAPPSPEGSAGRVEKYAAVQVFVREAAEKSRASGTFDEDLFCAEMVLKVAETFKYDAYGRNGAKPGDPFRITPATIKRYLK